MVEYGYDAASRATSITYKQNGTTVLGDLTYEYDKAGNRTKIGGSWARTGMPEALTTTSYDANNRQLTFGDKTLGYDDNGNLQSITDSSGTTLYSWNAKNQLVAIRGSGREWQGQILSLVIGTAIGDRYGATLENLVPQRFLSRHLQRQRPAGDFP